MDNPNASSCVGIPGTPLMESSQPVPQLALLDFFFPGFSVFSTAFYKYLGIDLNLYIPMVLLCGGMVSFMRLDSQT
jgi:mitochondrial chaperone BCS1